jgi:hypothetical protein
LPLLTTTDPTGSGSLFLLNIDGSSLNVYSAVVRATPAFAIPEPGTLLMLASGFVLVLAKRKGRGR